MTTTTTEETKPAGSSIGLWAGMLGAPAAWATQLQVSYAFVPWTCLHGHRWVLHVSTGFFVAISLICGVACFMEWRQVGGGSAEGSAGGPTERSRFLAVVGLMVSAMFSLLILAQGTASFFLNPCWE